MKRANCCYHGNNMSKNNSLVNWLKQYYDETVKIPRSPRPYSGSTGGRRL
jgi:hypothetical protein